MGLTSIDRNKNRNDNSSLDESLLSKKF
jgi:hypothetical protein